jgi:hypothetical protein|tara:strand:+ start:196 stop:582 length:387 start_codon:yes stop_codon:yes gene_type:complete
MTTEEAIDNIVAHVKIQHDIDVVFGDDEIGAYYHDSGIIGINNTESVDRQLFILLHEAGHVSLRRDQKRFLNIDETTSEGKRLRLLEEREAWREGRILANYMKININDKEWKNFSKKNIAEYAVWARQ